MVNGAGTLLPVPCTTPKLYIKDDFRYFILHLKPTRINFSPYQIKRVIYLITKNVYTPAKFSNFLN